ncbi:PDZ and LIM domain protein 7 [Taenia crassiceps]|uniref:PDZ and LIM domain protein 7 n=1 Tax=Taenia crassiceps TaxID=6207 RepID=A0ABR4QG68_9CEST
MVEKCAKCNGDITGQVVIALGQKWHNECFVCLGCRTPLQGKSFFNKDGSIYCIDCRKEKFDPTCAKCFRKIDPTIKYSIYQDKTYHRDCFTCAQCRLPLDGKRFVSKDGQFTCVSSQPDRQLASQKGFDTSALFVPVQDIVKNGR